MLYMTVLHFSSLLFHEKCLIFLLSGCQHRAVRCLSSMLKGEPCGLNRILHAGSRDASASIAGQRPPLRTTAHCSKTDRRRQQQHQLRTTGRLHACASGRSRQGRSAKMQSTQPSEGAALGQSPTGPRSLQERAKAETMGRRAAGAACRQRPSRCAWQRAAPVPFLRPAKEQTLQLLPGGWRAEV